MSDIKGNSEAASAKGKLKKGSKHKYTLLKEEIGIDRTARILENIERNIDEFIDSPDPKVRIEATRAFTEYYKPKRSTSEINLKTKVTVVFENIKENV